MYVLPVWKCRNQVLKPVVTEAQWVLSTTVVSHRWLLEEQQQNSFSSMHACTWKLKNTPKKEEEGGTQMTFPKSQSLEIFQEVLEC